MNLFPRSLLGRVFALYAGTLVVVAGCGLALFLGYQYQRQVEATRRDAEATLRLLLPVVTDAMVIGDYDTIQRQLRLAAHHSTIASTSFIDAKGGRLTATERGRAGRAPADVVRHIAAELAVPPVEVSAGGIGYGEVRIEPDAEAIAGALVQQSLAALALAAAGVAGGLVFIRVMLRRWLGHLGRIDRLGAELEGGQALAREAMDHDTPLEFRRTFEVLDRVASSLQAQREQAAATLQAIDDAVLACDVDGRIVLANEAALRLLGPTPGGLVGARLTDVLPALDQARDGHGAWPSRWKNRPLRWTGPDGEQRVLDSNLTPVTAADGTVIGQVLACRDETEQHRRDSALRASQAARDAAVTELRKSLEADANDGPESGGEHDDLKVVSRLVSGLVLRLRERSAQLDAIFALSPDGFVSFDRFHQVRYASPGFLHLTGLSADMVIGVEEEVLVQRLRSRCRSGQLLADLQPPQGGGRHLLELARPRQRVVELALHAGQAEAVSQVLHLRDVTHETEVDRMKSEFLTTAAHELRTPMASIFGFAELMLARPVPPERQRDVLETIHRQAALLINMVNELLDLARIEARQGKDFRITEHGLGPLIEETVEALMVQGDPRRVEAWVSHAGARLMVDADKTRQALTNVLSNAYKYSPQGGPIRLHTLERAFDGVAHVGVAVTDSGIGMTPAQKARLFERFYRADPSGNIPGTGLGMSIVKEIIELLGGRLEMRSEPAQGTVVTLWLPLATAAQAQELVTT